jgi:membrane-bound ClpP family serine protease
MPSKLQTYLLGFMCGVAIAIVVIIIAWPAFSAEVSIEKVDWDYAHPDELVVVQLTGPITVGDVNRIDTAYRTARAAKLHVVALEMRSWGGDGDTGVDIAAYIARHRLVVYTPDDCWSACAFGAFVALGHRKLIIGDSTKLGLHVVTVTATGKLDRAWTRWAAWKLTALGANSAPMDMMVNLPAGVMKFLDRNDLIVLGGQMFGTPWWQPW